MARIFVDINESNELNGFYTEGLHSAIPETAIEIDEETRELIINQHKKFKVTDITQPISLNNLTEIETEVQERTVTALEQIRADVDYIAAMTGVDLNV